MYRRRNYKRPRYNRDKYSVEQTLISTPPVNTWPIFEEVGNIQSSRQIAFSMLAPTDIQGMRKVKHFELTFSSSDSVTKFYYALVFVPQGYEPQRINIPFGNYATSAYDANQFVISQGILDFDAGPLRIKSPLSRNLNSGDSVYLLLSTIERDATTFMQSSVRFAS